MKIALDVMGGDYAPEQIIKGAQQALPHIDAELILVGNEKRIRQLLGDNINFKILHSSETIYMDEIPTRAVLRKRASSMKIAFELMRDGKVDAVISAGNSGAFVASAVFNLGLVQGIEKPAIASILPGRYSPFILIDSGASVDCKAQHLYQFALMGHALSMSYLGIKQPKVGLLSIGEESNKGNRVVKQAYEMLDNSPLNFIGNIEGNMLFDNIADVVVCDGFVGNIALKICESIAQYIKEWLSQELDKELDKKVEKKLDYEEYGGGIVMGIRGLAIICHGRSSSKAIKNAIIMAFHFLKNKIINKILLELDKISSFIGEGYGRA